MKPRYLVLAAIILTIGCTFGVLHEGPRTADINKVRLAPEVHIALDGMDRIEIFAGGVHVGTVLLDGQGGLFVGVDPTQGAHVMAELLRMFLPAGPKKEDGVQYR